MKRLFTLAIIAMIASFTFAQAPMAKKTAKKSEVVSIHAMEAKMKEAKEMKAVKAEKAAAAKETSTSVLRRNAKTYTGASILDGNTTAKVLQGVKFNPTKEAMPNARAQKAAQASKHKMNFGQPLLGVEVNVNQFKNASLSNAFKAPAMRSTTQEGNLTITTDANGIITDVTGVEAKVYQRANTGYAYYYSSNGMSITYQSGVCTIVEDGANVYIKDPVTEYQSEGVWVKGVKEGNVITVATKQPLYYSSKYGATVSLRWGLISSAGSISVADDHADAFTFTVDGDVITLEGTKNYTSGEDCYYMGIFWDDDNTNTGYGDAETVLTYNSEYVAPSTELVTVPEGTETATWYLNGLASEDDIVNKEVLVGANEDMEFYVQGLCTNFPEAWVKGVYDEATGIVTFAQGQYIGNFGGVYDMWFAGTSDWENGTLCDVTATYDAEANTITFDPEIDILENAKSDEIYCLEYYSNMVLSMEKQGGENPGQGGAAVVTTDANGIITSVTGGTPKYYQRSTDGTAYFVSSGSMVFDAQSGVVTTIEDGDVVYIKNPITKYTQNTWVKATKADGKLVVPAKQPLAYNANYDATISLRWSLIDAEGKIAAADANANAFTFTIDGDKLILEGTVAYGGEGDYYFMGAFWDDDNSATGYGDAETVLTLDEEYVAPVTEPVVVPEEAEVAEWYMNGNQISSSATLAIKNRPIKVAGDDFDFYIQGLSAEFPEAWVKGTYDPATKVITFKKNQWIGYESNYELDIWLLGYDTTVGDICDLTADYDFENSTITFNQQVVINGATDRLYYLERYDGVVLSMDAKEYVEPTITDLTAELPYLNTFETEAEQAEVAIYDANDDGSTFEVLQETEDNFGARYSYSSSNVGNDYLVFPGVKLEAGKAYKISVDARSISSWYTERFEVVVGAEAKASKLTTEVIPATDVTSTEYATFKNEEFTVEEDGTYFFAVHAISDPDQYRLWIDNFSVAELDPAAPLAVENLAVVAAKDGDNQATVTFTAPTKNVGGDDLTGKLEVAVTCDGEEVQELLVAPGKAVKLIAEVEEAGFHTFAVVATQGTHVSEVAKVKAYIGEDIPGTVEDLEGVDANNSVALTWKAPTEGVNGGVIIPENLKYNVYPVEMVEFFGMLFPETDYENPYFTGLTQTNATVDFNTNEGEQGYSYFAVTAENEQGESEDKYATVFTGAPYTLPFVETLPGNLTYWWGGDVDDENYDLDGGISAMPTTEDENGDLAFLFDAQTAGWMELYSGKINLVGKAALSFDYASTAAATLKLIVSAPGKEDVVVKTIELTASETMTTAQVSLEEFVNEPWVRLTWRADFAGEAALMIDNINIVGFDNELVAKAINAPAKIAPNTEFNVTVTVANQGVNEAEGYTVELYKNGQKVDEKAGASIASAASTTVAFAQTLAVTEEAATYKAVVVYDIDEDAANNETETVTVTVKQPNFPTVDDLAGTATTEGVKLTWSEPNLDAAAPEAVTEDFENAESFAQAVEGWTFVDADGAPAGGIQNVDIPGHVPGEGQLSWFVLDTDINTSYAGLSHSGHKHMSTMFNYPVGNVTPANDDWMISPELYGGAQTISFYATELTSQYGAEKMEVLYSTTDTELSSFISLGVTDVDVEWHEFSYDLPEGAKYFAIRYVSQDIFMLWVDDVTYIPAGKADLALVGYNIYRDGVKINDAPVAETSFVDAEATEGAHSYVVTVVYEQGESAPSNAVTIDAATGIQMAATNGTSIRTAAQSILVNNAEGQAVNVYTADGKAVANIKADQNTTIPVAPGFYIVEVGSKKVKVVVK